jgi:hypothetical protein
MTVPPLFGWETIAVGLVVLVVLTVAAVVVMAAGKARAERSEWEAWLTGRSRAPVGPREADGQPRGSGVEA